jgi:hypothetical protein
VLPAVLKEQRAEVASRIAALRELDARLARLERHLTTSRALPMLESTRDACCPAAAAVLDGEAGCACCAPVN